jgi:hypothetical protein
MPPTPPPKPAVKQPAKPVNPVRKAVAKQLVPPPTTVKPGLQPVIKKPGVLPPVKPKPIINVPRATGSGKWSMFKGGPMGRQTTALKRARVRKGKSPTGRSNQWR